MRKEKNERKRQMVQHAYQTVPIYFNLAEKLGIEVEKTPFEEFPIVDKGYFSVNGMSVISSSCIQEYMEKQLIWERTSGSSGKCSEVYWRKCDNCASMIGLWMLRKRYYDILPTQRLAYFFPSEGDGEDYVEGEYFLGISRRFLYNGCLKEMYERLLAYNPEWMILQPSLAMILCNLAKEEDRIPKALQYVEFTGEYLEPEVRRRTEQIFQCRTANQYGTKEVNSIAYECPCGSMHVMSDNVYVEILGEKDIGDICVTSLNNYAMPFVRFNLEDRGRLIRGVSCGCGKCGDLLEIRAGRGNDWIRRKSGEKLHAYALMQIIQRLNYITEGEIQQYRIIQRDWDVFEVLLVLGEPENYGEIASYIQEQFQKRLGEGTKVEVTLVQEILPTEKTGKLAGFISKMTDTLVSDKKEINRETGDDRMKYENNGLTRTIRDTLRLTGIILYGAWNEKYKQPKFLKNGAQEDRYQSLLKMIDEGRINEAENQLMEYCMPYEDIVLDTQDENRRENLEMALSVYGYMNDKDDNFLEKHDYERPEIQDGIETILVLFGVKERK